MTDSCKIHVCSDPVAFLAQRICLEARKKPDLALALSGGRTPRTLFSHLASRYRETIPWETFRIFQVDERGVPPTHEDSNWKQIQERLLDAIPGITAFRMEAERQEDGATDYEKILDRELPKNEEGIPCLDLVLLGMGPDGHTASLFPGTQALNETGRWVVCNEVPQLQTYRLTLTYPVLQAARHRWFLLKGIDKLETLRQVLEGEYPAGQLREVEWFVDEELGLAL